MINVKVGDVLVYRHGTESETHKKDYWLVLDIFDRSWHGPSGGRRVNIQILSEINNIFVEPNIDIAIDRIYDKNNLASNRVAEWYVL